MSHMIDKTAGIRPSETPDATGEKIDNWMNTPMVYQQESSRSLLNIMSLQNNLQHVTLMLKDEQACPEETYTLMSLEGNRGDDAGTLRGNESTNVIH